MKNARLQGHALFLRTGFAPAAKPEAEPICLTPFTSCRMISGKTCSLTKRRYGSPIVLTPTRPEQFFYITFARAACRSESATFHLQRLFQARFAVMQKYR
jgi:hypothetical protein